MLYKPFASLWLTPKPKSAPLCWPIKAQMVHAMYRSKQLLLHFLTLEDKLITICATCLNVKKRLITPTEDPCVSNDSENKNYYLPMHF